MIDIRIVYQEDWVQIFINGDLALEKCGPSAEDLAQALDAEGLVSIEVDWDRVSNNDSDSDDDSLDDSDLDDSED